MVAEGDACCRRVHNASMALDRIVTITMSAAIDRVIEAPGFSVGGHVAAREVARLPAGKGINVARALAKLGKECVAVAMVGCGERRWFQERLRAAGDGLLKARLISVKGPTRECLTIRDPVARAESHLRAEGAPVLPQDVERLRKVVLSSLDRQTLVAICGSVARGVTSRGLRQLVRECDERCAGVLVDSSGAALGAMAREAMWCLKVNAGELAALTGEPTGSLRQVILAARPLCDQRRRPPRVVVVTRGRGGAVLVTDRGAIHVGAPPLDQRISGSVGCGDAFLAGWLAASVDGADESKRLRFGVAVASAHAISRKPGTFSPRDAASFLRATTAESVRPR